MGKNKGGKIGNERRKKRSVFQKSVALRNKARKLLKHFRKFPNDRVAQSTISKMGLVIKSPINGN